MEGKTLTFELDIEEKSRKVIIDEPFDTVVVKNMWNSHGMEIPWEDDTGKKQHTYHNVIVLLEEIVKVYHFKYSGDSEFTEWELRINGVKYNGDICDYVTNENKLILTACIGSG